MEFKGTKEKWFVSQGAVDSNGIISSDEVFNVHSDGDLGMDICAVWKDVADNDTEAKYNALLISKAPEMLKMLEELITLHELGHEIGQYDKARQLIKEATEI